MRGESSCKKILAVRRFETSNESTETLQQHTGYNPMNTQALSLYNVDTNRPATIKQLYAVANHYAKLHNSEKAYTFRKIFGAILLKFQNENSKTPITMGDVTVMLTSKEVPKKFAGQITERKAPSKKVAPKVSTKIIAKPKAKSVAKPKAKVQPKASELSVEDFKKKFEALASKVQQHDTQFIEAEKRISSLEAKLDIIASQFEAFLTTDADAMNF
jgi:hypothetical protein